MSESDEYLVFIFDQYEEAGGWDDFAESFQTLENAIKFIMKKDEDRGNDLDQHAQIVYKEEIILRATKYVKDWTFTDKED